MSSIGLLSLYDTAHILPSQKIAMKLPLLRDENAEMGNTEVYKSKTTPFAQFTLVLIAVPFLLQWTTRCWKTRSPSSLLRSVGQSPPARSGFMVGKSSSVARLPARTCTRCVLTGS